MPIDDSRAAARRRAGAALGGLLAGTAAATVLTAALGWRLEAVLAGQTGAWHVDGAVEAGVTAVGLLVAGWLAVSALVAAACVLARGAGASWRAGERLVQGWAPGLVRKALVVVVGASAGLGLASGASAAVPEPTPSLAVTVDAADLGWAVTTSDRHDAPEPADVADPTPASADLPALAPAAPTPAPPTAPAAETVVVAVGDSLWAIAARHLPAGATDAQIAAAWPQWYHANAGTIGADPDVILPGQVLVAPGASS
ncbi:LysM peptidoglycan-binding domain-containing protein [Cellulomonas sp. ICMP 17802]|uniref:LysM peptidoglycan-binding domain-containing protein n=1 Tax=Cellulomonas sp. ICMP 17802 TaxID=3239199 RepID=UPI00351B82B1